MARWTWIINRISATDQELKDRENVYKVQLRVDVIVGNISHVIKVSY